jgi:acetylornithine deacetylase/succinyl-diaminopimelate desuccinylase-like protein
MVPRKVEAEVDIRVPFGISPQEVLAWARRTLDEAGLEDGKLELALYNSSASYTDPKHPLGLIMKQNAELFYGVKPTYTMTTGATDGRFFRQLGIPTVIYGPRPHNSPSIDEFITIRDFLAVLKVHVCSAIDYIAEAGKV